MAFTVEQIADLSIEQLAELSEQLKARKVALRGVIEQAAKEKIARIQEIRETFKTLNTEIAELRLWCRKNEVTIPREGGNEMDEITAKVEQTEKRKPGRPKKAEKVA